MKKFSIKPDQLDTNSPRIRWGDLKPGTLVSPRSNPSYMEMILADRCSAGRVQMVVVGPTGIRPIGHYGVSMRPDCTVEEKGWRVVGTLAAD